MIKLPKLVKFTIILTFIEIVLFTLFRIGFLYFMQFEENLNLNEILFSFFVGFRFDLQFSLLVLLPLFLLGSIPIIGIFKSTFGKYFWFSYLIFCNLIIIILLVTNFVYYSFFKLMLDSSILRFLYDFKDAWEMAATSYPIYKVTFIAIIFLFMFYFVLEKIYKYIDSKEVFLQKKQKRIIYIVFTLLFIFGGYGKFEWYPWRWSEAFWTSNTYLNTLSSNPITYFVNTLKNTDEKYNEKLVEKYYDSVAQFLEVNPSDPNKKSLVRVVDPNHEDAYTFTNPNIVFILGESTSFARTSISGNPLNPTPFLKSMSDNGITYSNYFTPHAGTARNVWTSLTGMADIERMKTSSRNPMVVKQNMILNSLEGYKKFYFIGGSLSWGNVRGVISNVQGMKSFEEGSYSSPRNDVWGISDAHLAGEVNDVLKNEKEPFFAYVQLAGNHSPNTIPEENFGFKRPEKVSKEKLLKYSFDGKYEELEGQAFLDHSVKRFISLAEKEKYFDNTIFIFVGDHGLPRRADHMHEAEQTYSTHTIRTPLIIYAPKLLKHKQIDYPVSSVDIMATIAGLSGNSYINSSFGRDLLEKGFENKPHYAYYMTHDQNPEINLIGKEYILRVRANGDNPRLFKYYYTPEEKNINYYESKPDIAEKMSNLVRGLYETTRYVRFNNSTEVVEEYLKNRQKTSEID